MTNFSNGGAAIVTDWAQVGARIQAQRKARGLTQAQLGALIGATANHVAQVEGGLAISEKKLDIYAQALGVTVVFLRYGVATGPDVAALTRVAYLDGRRDGLASVQTWLAQQLVPVRPAAPEDAFAPDPALDYRFTDEEVKRAQDAAASRQLARRSRSPHPGSR